MIEATVLIICIIMALFSLAIIIRCLLAQRRIQWLSPSSANLHRTEKISVIIPARDEERDITSCLRSVLSQEGVDLEVIVVNDHSTDRTGAIIDDIARTDSRVRVFHNPPLIPGWLGKCNAMQFGAASATGEYLLFSDADIIHRPHCFSTVLNLLELDGYDFISLFPHFDNFTFWENVNLPIYLFGIAKILAEPGPEDPGNPKALATGALMLVRKRTFKEVRGFHEVKGEMLDDVGLARVLKSRGFRVGYRLAPKCARARLFKTNHEAFWGTTKNILVAVEGHIWLALPLLIIGILQNCVPFCAMAIGILRANAPLLITGVLTYVIQYMGLFSVYRIISFHPIKALFFPLSAVVGTCCIIRALIYQSRGVIFWRGRAIKVK